MGGPLCCLDTLKKSLTRLDAACQHDPYRHWGDTAWQAYRFGVSPDDVAQLCGVNQRAVRRWDQSGRAPRWALKLLILARGFVLEPGWEGYYFENGALHRRGEPVCWPGFAPENLEYLQNAYARLRTAECEVRELRALLERLQGPAEYRYAARPRLVTVDGCDVG